MRAWWILGVALAGCVGDDGKTEEEEAEEEWAEDCADTCQRIYGDGGGECGIEVPGADAEELDAACTEGCERLYGVEGEIGDYSPNERVESDEDVTLENEAQAEIWMDCVAETACEYLTEGYCAPIDWH